MDARVGFWRGCTRMCLAYPQNVHLAPLPNVAYYKAKMKSCGSEASIIKGVQFENEKIVLKCVKSIIL
jgi:hypothetical protein